MMTRFASFLSLLCTLFFAAITHGAELKLPVNDAESTRFFEEKVRPLLVDKCFQCHDDKKQKGDLRLDSRAAMLLGGENGPAIVPGDIENSTIVKAIRYDDLAFQMPPKRKMKDEDIATLTRWIKLGAPWPGEEVTKGGVQVRPKTSKITDDDRNYWYFQPLKKSPVPVVKDKTRVTNAIDAFVLSKLEAAGLSYAPAADKLTLIRRATFDLHGLPPTQEEIDAFMSDSSADAFEKLLDRLLASPRYGERMGRRWLDLVRYSDSDGFRADEYRPHIWRYRDWVIRAFNADMPYDEFVTHQLAGDEAKPGDPDALIAMGYLRLFPYEYNQRDVHKQWNEIIDDVTTNAGEVFFGLSMHCARCHNHKFDPILQEDYYKLRAFFAPILPDDTITAASIADRAAYDRKMAIWLEKTKEIREKMEAIEAPVRAGAVRGAVNKFTEDLQAILNTPVDQLPPFERQIRYLAYRQVDREIGSVAGRIKGEKKAEYDKLEVELRKFDPFKPAPLTLVTAIRDVSAIAPQTKIPGDRLARVIEPGFLSVLSPEASASAGPLPGPGEGRHDDTVRFVSANNPKQASSPKPQASSTGRRLQLAQWITRPDNALTTRIIVNRLWQYHFGVGIVGTANDFGRQGDRPTHPELLDWLANEFVAGGWSFKKLHKTMMLSQAYQQVSHGVDNEIDPANTLLWKQRSQRLEAEQIRDAMLRASGELDLTMHGPGAADGSGRRSIYLKFMRNNRPELIETFDGPDGFNSIARRNVTTIAPQSLMLMNGEWTLTRARKLAEQARRLGGGDHAKMIDVAYGQALGRAASAQEKKDVLAFIDSQSKARKPEVLVKAKPAATEQPSVEGIAIDYRKGQHMRLSDDASLKFEEFTVEAVFMLRSIDTNANVRTIASQWDGAQDKPGGWSIGVTGQRSKFMPQTVILQLVGRNEDGMTAYDVVVSGLKPNLNQLYHLIVRVQLSEQDSTGISFLLRPLIENAQTEVAEVGHTVIRDIDNNAAFVVGGRDAKGTNASTHGWDGVLSNVRLYKEAISPQQLVGGRSPKHDALVGDWRFGPDAFEKDSSGKGRDLKAINLSGEVATIEPIANDGGKTAGKDPRFEAFIDFCHVLLNSNEFLYVD